MKKIIILGSVVAISILSSCTSSTTVPFSVTDNVIGSKVGSAKAKCFLGFCGNINTGAGQAAKNGGISKIATVEYKITSKFGGLVAVYETIVSGE